MIITTGTSASPTLPSIEQRRPKTQMTKADQGYEPASHPAQPGRRLRQPCARLFHQSAQKARLRNNFSLLHGRAGGGAVAVAAGKPDTSAAKSQRKHQEPSNSRRAADFHTERPRTQHSSEKSVPHLVFFYAPD